MENSSKPVDPKYPGRPMPPKTEVKTAECAADGHVKALREKQLDKNFPYVGN